MIFRFVEPDLRKLEALGADAVVCGIFEDQRPMRGLAGLLDWRLGGDLSARLRERFVTGEAGDALLMPSRPRLPFEQLVLTGLGPRASFADDAFRAAIAHVVRLTRGLLCKRAILELPGRGDGAIDAGRAAELLLEAAGADASFEGFWIVEQPDTREAFVQRAMQETRRLRRL